jgi:hypothetical protein
MNSSSSADTLIASAGSSFQWYENNNPIPGAVYPGYVPTQNGNYTVVITDANGCTGNSAVFSYTTLGISNASQSIRYSLFPNPASDFLNIHAEENALNKEMSLLNVSGNVVMKIFLTDTNTKIDLSKISEGIYLVVVGIDHPSISKILISR